MIYYYYYGKIWVGIMMSPECIGNSLALPVLRLLQAVRKEASPKGEEPLTY